AHTTTGCGKQGFPSAQPYLSHTPGANPFCCMFFMFLLSKLSIKTLSEKFNIKNLLFLVLICCKSKQARARLVHRPIEMHSRH
ncbi:hypothetical protein BP00DRAFT_341387, partial [Aspergillus indologenus CBS 114.80]